jgi:hypothetical protein
MLALTHVTTGCEPRKQSTGAGSSASTGREVRLGAEYEGLLREVQKLSDDLHQGKVTIAASTHDGPAVSGRTEVEDELRALTEALSRPQVVAFMQAGVDGQRLIKELLSWPEVSDACIVSAAEAAARLRTELQDHPGGAGRSVAIDANSLQSSLEIWLDDPDLAKSVADRVAGMAGVQETRASASLVYAVAAIRARTHPTGE